MNKCEQCIYAIWENDQVIGCNKDDCVGGVVQYDD